MEIKIFKPEMVRFSVTVMFACESASQSGTKKISEWINHFISLRSINPEWKDEYSKCLAVLKHACFCEGTYAEIEHDTENNRKVVKISIFFNILDTLTKFSNTLEESVRFT